MNNALRTRQRMFALALPLTAALYIGAEGISRRRCYGPALSRAAAHEASTVTSGDVGCEARRCERRQH